MKIRGPSDPAGPIEGAESTTPAPRTAFADRLDQAGAAKDAEGASAVGPIAETARALEAGQATPREVLDRLII